MRSATEKFEWKFLDIAHMIKLEMDLQFGCSWHVVVGENYSCDIDFEDGCMCYIFFGSLAILIWKSGSQLLKEAK